MAQEKVLHVAICGGALQGMELCWLAQKAGWNILLLDKNANPPARYIADSFIQCDLTGVVANHEPEVVAQALEHVDILFPAIEDTKLLMGLDEWCRSHAIPFAFDPDAYAVSHSKLASRLLFQACDTPIPEPCVAEPHFPMIAKPDCESGSRGVTLLHTKAELLTHFPEGISTPNWVFESYVEGTALSIEVCGAQGEYLAHQITVLEMDTQFDCCRVIADGANSMPYALPVEAMEQVRDEALQLAQAVNLRGLMDLEVLLTDSGMQVLEIDARFPSQTPTAVYLSSGMNLAYELARCFIALPEQHPAPQYSNACCIYEHIECHGGTVTHKGEHILSQHGAVQQQFNFFGSDEALVSNMQSDCWVATLMFTGATLEQVQEKRKSCLANIQNHLNGMSHD